MTVDSLPFVEGKRRFLLSIHLHREAAEAAPNTRHLVFHLTKTESQEELRMIPLQTNKDHFHHNYTMTITTHSSEINEMINFTYTTDSIRRHS